MDAAEQAANPVAVILGLLLAGVLGVIFLIVGALAGANTAGGGGGFTIPAGGTTTQNVLRWRDQVCQYAQTYAPQAGTSVAEFDNWVFATMTQESGGVLPANSHAGAEGLMQLMPGTAADEGFTGDLQDPSVNLPAGEDYIASRWQQYGGNLGALAAAYNGGDGVGKEYLQGGLGATPTETQGYVPAVLANYGAYSKLPQDACGAMMPSKKGG